LTPPQRKTTLCAILCKARASPAPYVRTGSLRISVVMVPRDGPVLFARAIDSIRAQDHDDLDLVVVDNASATPIALPNARVIRTGSPVGAAVARNIALDHADGDVVCFLDDDDFWLPDKLADIVATFSADPDLDFCYADTVHIGPDGRELMVSRGPCDVRTFLRRRHIHLNALALRRSAAAHYRFNPGMLKYSDVEFVGRIVRDLRGHPIRARHAVWNRDGRPDQLTQKNFRRSWLSWKILCTVFDPQIRQCADLRRYYHRRMALLSLMFLDVRQANLSVGILLGAR
jgi:glycosyltransferase involved in cell wall biosynthesis